MKTRFCSVELSCPLVVKSVNCRKATKHCTLLIRSINIDEIRLLDCRFLL